MDKEYTSVSKILEFIWPFPLTIPDNILQRSIRLGNCVHEQLEKYVDSNKLNKCKCIENAHALANDNIGENGLPEYDYDILKEYNHNMLTKEMLEIINSLIKDKTFYVEKKLRDDKLMIRGAIDLVAKDNDGNIIIVDYKTSTVAIKYKWRYQTFLYAYLYTGSWELAKQCKLIVLNIHNRIGSNGKPILNKKGYRIYEFDTLRDIEIEILIEKIEETKKYLKQKSLEEIK